MGMLDKASEIAAAPAAPATPETTLGKVSYESRIDDPFKNITGLVSADTIVPAERLKIAIVGKPKTGKSWMAATAPKPIMYYDFDGRAESIAGRTGIKVKTLIDLDSQKPQAVMAIESDLAAFQYAKLEGRPVPATFVFDSITYFKKCMENELIKQESSFGRKIRLGLSKQLQVAAGWDVINGVRGYLEYIINSFSQLGNVIFVFHQRDEKDRDKSTKTETAYTGRQTVDPQYLETVLALFNEVYFIDIDYNNNYVVQVKANAQAGASTTLRLDANEKPDIAAMIEKHKQRLATGTR